MRFSLHILACFLCIYSTYGQRSIEKTLEKLNTNSVPYIQAETLNTSHDLVLLDARTLAEYQVSHLKDALWVGRQKNRLKEILLQITDKNTPIVVYCSIGVRSERIGEKLIAKGYSKVYNLYGGIFLWKNSGFTVYDPQGQKTNKVHAYNKYWGSFLTNADKIY
ncbi:Rhodanese-related sulfurtransferase [Arenibacter nanhaiticus]|uniref:Rhodanese-related sulfurtransferase n=1 Tax=Arenibacter nanhaiticus TaxID=558155 RepID=A0A1M6I1S7_9FLAO|nr:rhodanese-like domain-containing protein [Arenibacter nanhaiticus]SHJ28423.1 Rhodanese-related sulfurtransferase [Arenibacter nanhaiticus]